MIPSFMDERSPPGERDVYNLLAAGEDTWVALHSLDLAPWNRSLRTEIDFVVIVPDSGILCIEVKSHDFLSFENDRWVPPEIKRSPFKQAADGSHAFHRRLRDLEPQFGKVPVVHCCIFPRARFDLPPNLSVQPWELMDARAFRTFPSGSALCADLWSRMRQAIQAEGIQPLESRLAQDRVERLVNCCLPVQRRRPDARAEIVQREEDIARILRVQQKPVLQLAELNERLVVSGGAGTGKTLIAMEIARRAADRGKRVALLCFNQLVGDWMRRRMEQMVPPLPNLVVGRAIRVMAEMAGLVIPDNPSPDFWTSVLPAELEERLTDPDFNAAASFDYLVVDEAQDLLARPTLWQCLTQFLAGGAAQGSFAVFGDFDHQVLSDRDAMIHTLSELNACAGPARWRLSENCRNYQIVGDTAVRLSGCEGEVYSGYMRTGWNVQNYNISFYEDNQAQLAKLAALLKDFQGQGYRPGEISILSFCPPDSSAAAQLEKQGFRLRQVWQAGEGTGYTSVHAFKGMENKVVILTDVTARGPDFHRHLFYTGMTRATESVRILCEEGSKEHLSGWLLGRVGP